MARTGLYKLKDNQATAGSFICEMRQYKKRNKQVMEMNNLEKMFSFGLYRKCYCWQQLMETVVKKHLSLKNEMKLSRLHFPGSL